MRTSSAEHQAQYRKKYQGLISIIEETDGDRQIMAKAKEYDTEHGTEMFAEAVHLTIYCIACSKFDCDC